MLLSRDAAAELEEEIEPVIDVIARAFPRRSRLEIRRWLLGDHAHDEDARVLVDAARRASRLRVRAAGLMAGIRGGRI